MTRRLFLVYFLIALVVSSWPRAIPAGFLIDRTARWPKEMEALLARSRTVGVAAQKCETVYEIAFERREDFERYWPIILRVKTPGAPVILSQCEASTSSAPAQTAMGTLQATATREAAVRTTAGTLEATGRSSTGAGRGGEQQM